MITHDNDISLVKLAKKAFLNTFVNTLCLPTWGPQTGARCQIAGWGATMEHGRASVILMKAEVPLIGREVCSHPDVYGAKITDNMMCAGYARGGIDTCQGDSGGPLHCQSKEDLGRWEIQGVASWGRGCGRQMKYGVYTVVGNYLQWIQCIMEASTNCFVTPSQSEVQVKSEAATTTTVIPTMSILPTRTHFETKTETRSPMRNSKYTVHQTLSMLTNRSREPITPNSSTEPSTAYSNERHEINSKFASSPSSHLKLSGHNLPCRKTVMLRSRIMLSNELQQITSSGSLDTNTTTQQNIGTIWITKTSKTVQMTSVAHPISTYRSLETTQFTRANNWNTILEGSSTANQIQKSRYLNSTKAANKRPTSSYLSRTNFYATTDYLTQTQTVVDTSFSKSELLRKTSANSVTVGVLATTNANTSSFTLNATNLTANTSETIFRPTIVMHNVTSYILFEESSALFASIAPSVSRDDERRTQTKSKNAKSTGTNLIPAQFQTILIPKIFSYILLEYIASYINWI